MFKINLKEKNAITLIALIITIIVLLILAGISLNLVMGDGGILTRATNARKTTDIAGAQEKVELLAADYSLEYLQQRYVNRDTTEENAGVHVASQLNIYATRNSTIDGCSLGVSETMVRLSKDGKTVTGTIHDDGSITWESGLTIPDGLEIGSTITWTPSGSYVWDQDLYSSVEDSKFPNNYLASGVKASSESMRSRYEELSAMSYENVSDARAGAKERSALNHPVDMTISEWKVLSKTDISVVIVPDEPTSGKVKLIGPQGFNNGVKLLDDACSSLYGSEKGITARSIKIDDIEDAIKEVGNEDVLAAERGGNFNTYPYPAYTSNRDYPLVWADTVGSVVDGVASSGSLGLSDQPDFYSNRLIKTSNNVVGGVTAGVSIRALHCSSSGRFTDLFQYRGGGNEIRDKEEKYLDIFGRTASYWMSSRVVYANSNKCGFGCNVARGGSFNSVGLFFSDGSLGGASESYSLFPVVTLSSGVISEKSGGGYTFTPDE